MSLKKHFDEKNPVCKVTFMLDKNAASSANRVNLAGDFNNWDIKNIPMKKIKGGEFSASVDLKKGREYEFKYLIDGKKWVNEPAADKQVANVFQSDNSVVIV
jgi:1,4-alpha-glucan branching enzyme